MRSRKLNADLGNGFTLILEQEYGNFGPWRCVLKGQDQHSNYLELGFEESEILYQKYAYFFAMGYLESNHIYERQPFHSLKWTESDS